MDSRKEMILRVKEGVFLLGIMLVVEGTCGTRKKIKTPLQRAIFIVSDSDSTSINVRKQGTIGGKRNVKGAILISKKHAPAVTLHKLLYLMSTKQMYSKIHRQRKKRTNEFGNSRRTKIAAKSSFRQTIFKKCI